MVHYRFVAFQNVGIGYHYVDLEDDEAVVEWALKHWRRKNRTAAPHEYNANVTVDKILEIVLDYKYNDLNDITMVQRNFANQMLHRKLVVFDSIKMMLTNATMVRHIRLKESDDCALFIEDLASPTATDNSFFLDIFRNKVKFTYAEHKLDMVMAHICRAVDQVIYVPLKDFIKKINTSGESYNLGFWKEDFKGEVEKALELLSG